MKVDYINSDIRDDFVRVTFVGYDAKGRRRPVIDLDASDLRRLIETAVAFRQRQRYLAKQRTERADNVTAGGLTP